jgi:hypothetical protein
MSCGQAHHGGLVGSAGAHLPGSREGGIESGGPECTRGCRGVLMANGLVEVEMRQRSGCTLKGRSRRAARRQCPWHALRGKVPGWWHLGSRGKSMARGGAGAR